MKSHRMFRVCVALMSVVLLSQIASVATAGYIVSANPGYTIASDGSEGAFYGLAVPDNLALASNGATAFADGVLGGVHTIAGLNDGVYGNSNSWISDDDTPDVNFAGIDLPGTDVTYLSAIAWGRDNLASFNDRNQTLYTLQRTLVTNPDATTSDTGNAATGWETFGTIDYQSDDDLIIGALFTGRFRHQWNIGLNGAGVPATGIRLVMPTDAVATAVALDEIELYLGQAPPVPEPSTFLLLGLGALGLLRHARRRRRA